MDSSLHFFLFSFIFRYFFINEYFIRYDKSGQSHLYKVDTIVIIGRHRHYVYSIKGNKECVWFENGRFPSGIGRAVIDENYTLQQPFMYYNKIIEP